MTRTITVDAGVDPDAEPIVIQLRGNDLNGEPLPPQEFRCLAEPRGRRFIELIEQWNAAVSESQQHESPSVAARLSLSDTIDFIASCIVPADADRFRATLDTGDMIVTSSQLAGLFRSLISEYTGRPTERPSSLPDGSEQTAPTSTAASSWGQSKSSAMEDSARYSTPLTALS